MRIIDGGRKLKESPFKKLNVNVVLVGEKRKGLGSEGKGCI